MVSCTHFCGKVISNGEIAKYTKIWGFENTNHWDINLEGSESRKF